MKSRNKHTFFVVQTALIAAIYAAVTFFSVPLSFGTQQLRISEVLTVLPILTPAAVPGLTIGCIIANLSSPYGIADMVCGAFATLIAAAMTRLARKITYKNQPLLSMVFPVIFNGLIIGVELSFFLPEGVSFTGFLTMGASVALSEAVVCYILGLPLLAGLKKTKIFNEGLL